MNHISAKTNANPLDVTQPERYRSPIAVNPATGNASPNHTLADAATMAVFLRPLNATHAPFQWQVVVGSLRAAGSNVPVLQTLPCACHPECKRGAGLKFTLEAITMPRIALRAFLALFPIYAISVSTLATPYRFTVSGVAA